MLLSALAGLAVALLAGSGSSPPSFTPRGQAIATVLSGTQAAPAPTRRAPSFRPAASATGLARKLSLAQQVAQLFLVSLDGRDRRAVSGLGKLAWGGVVLTSANFRSAGQVSALTADLVMADRNAGYPPPLQAVLQAGGPDNAFAGLPPAGEARLGDGGQPAQAMAQALRAGRRLGALHLNMTLAPLADVDTLDGALNGRLFSSDPATVGRFSAAAAAGWAKAGMIAAAGHFPGEGAASADPDQLTATVGGSLAQLRGRDLVPFAAIARQVPVILMSNAEYAALDGVTPAGLLPTAVKLLRDGYGFGGVVMSDDLDATLNPTGEGPGQVALQALEAGDDLLYISGPHSEHLQAYDAVLAAARRQPRVRALVRSALLRDLTLKARYGVLKQP